MFLVAFATSCAHPRAKSGGEVAATPIVGPVASPLPEVYGPPVPVAAPDYGPQPLVERKWVLVLGPGRARAYADVGVLRALHDAKVPVAAIVGTEVGAIFGALYAADQKVNSLDWAILKLKAPLAETFETESSSHAVSKTLDELFANQRLESSTLPIRILWRDGLTGAGATADAVRQAIAQPEASAEKLILAAKGLGLGPVLYVDLGDGPAMAPGDIALHPALSGLGRMDFDKRSELIFRGKQSVVKAADLLRQPTPGAAR